jgi:polysaccharide deacetylase 2 family uncharacterized protein YibQ
VATPRRKPRSAAGRSKRGSGPAAGWRVGIALLLLVGGIALVVSLAGRRHRLAPQPKPTAEQIVRQVAARHGCPAGRITTRLVHDANGEFFSATIHAPQGFAADRFSLDLQATAHNLEGDLEPKHMLEEGGYGLARLEGEVLGERWRILVLRETPLRGPVLATPPARGSKSKLAIVLDDAGQSLDVVGEVAKLPAAVAVAVLPNALHSAEVARELGAEGREVLLHMPMEPLANHGVGPGPGAIEVGMGESEVRRCLDAALSTVADAKGVNNHMGSRATADAALMHDVMSVLRGRKLFFLDSRTTAETVAENEARAEGIPTMHRDVFLDVVGEPDAIRQALDAVVERARLQGSAVAIGHVHPVTLAVLARALPHLPPDVVLVRPSHLARAAN